MNNKSSFTARLVSLQEVYKLVHQLAQNIMKTGHTFDLVIAIARGGMLPGRLVCDFLNIGQLTSIQIRHYTGGARQLASPEILDPVRIPIEGKSILMMDDVNDSGKTLHAAHEHLSSRKPATIRSAVVHEKQNDRFHADFVGTYLEEWKWLMYQWAAAEDILGFLKRDGMLGGSSKRIKNHLAQKYDLHLEEVFIGNILKLRSNYYP